jgi:hypothetical protein
MREDANGWRLDKGTLIVRTSAGGLWQKENDGGNILLRTPPNVQDGKLVAEVLVDIEPTNVFENAGLIWYYDGDNYVIMVKERIGNDIHMQFVAEKDGTLDAGFHKTFNEGGLGEGWPMQTAGARRTRLAMRWDRAKKRCRGKP